MGQQMMHILRMTIFLTSTIFSVRQSIKIFTGRVTSIDLCWAAIAVFTSFAFWNLWFWKMSCFGETILVYINKSLDIPEGFCYEELLVLYMFKSCKRPIAWYPCASFKSDFWNGNALLISLINDSGQNGHSRRFRMPICLHDLRAPEVTFQVHVCCSTLTS